MIKIKNICIITDFDHTITTKNSKSTWDILEMSKSIPNKYKEECQNNKNYYLKKERDCKLPFNKKSNYMKKWSEKNLEIFTKSKIKKEEIKKLSTGKNLRLKKYSKDFFKYTSKNNIPVIIISAGIEDVIKYFLKSKKLLNKNVYIISNKLKYKKGKIIGIKNKKIHSLNKAKIIIPKNIQEIINNKKRIFLLGDNIEDTLLTPKNREKDTIKIGFLNKKENISYYKKEYDIVLEKDTFKEILKIIKYP